MSSSQLTTRPSFRQQDAHLVILAHHLEQVTAVALHQDKLTAVDGALVLLVVEFGDVLLPATDDIACGGEMGLIACVDAVAEGFSAAPKVSRMSLSSEVFL